MNFNFNLFRIDDAHKNVFIFLFIYSVLFIFPIILANVYYVDDIGRVMSGGAAWNTDGRPLMYILAKILSNGSTLIPVFPVPLILSVFLLDYTIVLLIQKYIKETSLYALGISFSLIFSNWFLLENFSYSFEALGMVLSLSIFFSFYIIFDKLNTKKYYIISFMLCVINFSIYQATVGAYLAMISLELGYYIFTEKKYKEILLQLFARFIPLIMGFLFYKITIAAKYVGAYGAEHAGIIMPFSTAAMHQIAQNIFNFSRLLGDYLWSLGPACIIILSVLIAATIKINREFWRESKRTKSSKILSICYFSILPFLLILLCILPLILLKAPVFAPRVMLSLTVFFLYVSFLFFYVIKEKKWVGGLACLILLVNLTFAASYGIILNREDKHDSQIAQYIVYDLNQIENETGERYKRVSLVGSAGPCHELELEGRKKPLMRRLIPIYMTNDWHWGGKYLQHYRAGSVDNEKLTDEDKAVISNSDPLKRNEFYRLYINEDKVIVVFPSAKI